MYAIRTSISPSTGFTPAEMILGSHIKLPVDLLTSNIQDLQSKPNTYGQRQAQQFVSDLGREVKKTFEQSRLSLAKSRKQMKIQYDKKTTPHKLRLVIMSCYGILTR